MRLTRIGVPAIAFTAIVLVGAATAGVLAARVGVDSAADVIEPTPAAVAEPSSAPASALSPQATAKPTPAPTEPPIEISTRQVVGKSVVPMAEPTLAPKDSGAEGSGDGAVYTWQDGKATRRVILQDDLVFQRAADRQPGDVVIASVGEDSIVRREARHGADAGPVFRSESGGELMTLPGGVLVLLNPAWDQSEVTSFFDRNTIAADRRSPLGALTNGFQIETEPGFPSLNLSNALAGQDGVVLANPNWWRDIVTK